MKLFFKSYGHLFFTILLLQPIFNLSASETSSGKIVSLKQEIAQLRRDITAQKALIGDERKSKSILVILANRLEAIVPVPQEVTAICSEQKKEVRALALNEVYKNALQEKEARVQALKDECLIAQCSAEYWQTLSEDEQLNLAFKACRKFNNDPAFKSKCGKTVECLFDYLKEKYSSQELSSDLKSLLEDKIKEVEDDTSIEALQSLTRIQEITGLINNRQAKSLTLQKAEEQSERIREALAGFSSLPQQINILLKKLNNCTDPGKCEKYLTKLAYARILSNFTQTIAYILENARIALITHQIKAIDLAAVSSPQTLARQTSQEFERFKREAQLATLKEQESPRNKAVEAIKNAPASPRTSMKDVRSTLILKQIANLQEEVSLHRGLLEKIAQESPESAKEMQDQARRINSIQQSLQKACTDLIPLLAQMKTECFQDIKLLEQAIPHAQKTPRRKRGSSLLRESSSSCINPSAQEE